MNGRKARAAREAARELRYLRVLAASPLPLDEKVRLWESAEYMAARLRGDPTRPPAHWPPEQIAAWAAVLADPVACSAALNWALEGWWKLNTDADALEDAV
jgi:hypothetical protein